jgi:hypothetical protein
MGRRLVLGICLLATMMPSAAHAQSTLGPGCSQSRVAVAHQNGRVLSPQPSGSPHPCETTTGFGGAETQVVVTNDGSVVYEPAIITPGLLGTGFLDGVPGPRLDTQVSPSGLAVSADRGGTWSFVQPAGSTWIAQDSSLFVDRRTGRLFYYALGANPIPTAGIPLQDQLPAGYAHLMASADDGRTWTQTAVPGFIESENPRFTAAPPPTVSNANAAANYPNVVYWCGNNMLFTETYRACYRSFDGGLTWEYASILFSQPLPQHSACGTSAETFNSGDGNYPEGAPDGSLYVLVSCGSRTFLARSQDEAQSWPLIAQPNGSPVALPATDELRVDPKGNLYGFHLAGNRIEMRVSRNHGVTWSRPVDTTLPGVTSITQWAVAERGDGEVAIATLGQRSGHPPYDGLMTVTHDALAATPTFWTAVINGSSAPMYAGSPPAARDDFIGVDIGPDGTPWAGFFGSCRANAVDPACRGQASNPESNEAVAGRLA